MSRSLGRAESESEGEVESLEERIRSKLTSSGELDKLKKVLCESLTECGWKEEVRQLCKEFVERRGVGNVTPEDIVKAVRSLGHRAVPDTVKADFVAEVKRAVYKAIQQQESAMAVSHVGLVFQGDAGYEDQEKRYFDEAKSLMLVARDDKLLAFTVAKGSTPASSKNCLLWEMEIPGVGEARLVVLSPDQKSIALQQDERSVQFIDRTNGNTFVEVCKKPTKTILGLFFVECEEGNLVLVTSTGLELHRYSGGKKRLQLRNKLKQSIRWYIYTYATRVVSMGTGKTGARIVGYQFTWGEIIKLPHIDFDAAPFPVTPEDLVNASMNGIRQPPPLVTAEDVVLLRLYDRVFVGHIDRSRMRLRLYRVFMDTIMLIREYELFSPLLAFSVVDNVVLLHQRQASVAVLLDVASQSSESVGSPLPLTEVLSTTNNGESSSSVSIRKFSAKWNFFLPNVIVDEKGKMYRAQLDLPAVVASFTAPNLLVGFLNRRRPGVHSNEDPRDLLLEVLRRIFRRKESRQDLRQIFNTLHMDGSEDLFQDKGDKPAPPSLKLQSSLLDVRDIYKEVLGTVLDAQEADPAYIEEALVECMESACKKGVQIPEAAYLVMIDALLKQKKIYQLQQQLAASKEMQNLIVAEHLEARADESGSDLIRKMSLHVYSRCGVQGTKAGKQTGCELYCKKLLKAGKVISALRVAQHHQITTFAAPTFLDAAKNTGEPRIVQAVERFCSQPGRVEAEMPAVE